MTDARASEAGTYVVTERLSWRKEGRGTGRVVREGMGRAGGVGPRAIGRTLVCVCSE